MASSYRGDPHWLRARYGGTCSKCGERFERGAEVFYYPRHRRIYVGDCARAAAADFATMVEAEDWLGGVR
jgi:hypothetical protein